MVWTGDGESLVTAEMLGAFLVFGVDIIAVIGVLWLVGTVSTPVAGAVSALIVGLFLVWVLVRWWKLREDEPPEPDPLETLQQRYADGELTDAEFERRVETLLGSSERAESTDERDDGLEYDVVRSRE